MYNNPYFNPMQTYMPNQNMYKPLEQSIQPNATQTYTPSTQFNKPAGLLGKSVDSIEVVKATDIPLDGSVSYFPLTDGSAIVTKQLMQDGTSKTIIYKPTEEEQKETPKYVTSEELKESIKNIDLSDIDDLKDDIKELRQEIKDLKKSKKKDD